MGRNSARTVALLACTAGLGYLALRWAIREAGERIELRRIRAQARKIREASRSRGFWTNPPMTIPGTIITAGDWNTLPSMAEALRSIREQIGDQTGLPISPEAAEAYAELIRQAEAYGHPIRSCGLIDEATRTDHTALSEDQHIVEIRRTIWEADLP